MPSIEKSLNERVKPGSTMRFEVMYSPSEPEHMFIKHHYFLNGQPRQYNTKIKFSHLEKLGHEAFVDRLYKVLMYRMFSEVTKYCQKQLSC